MKQLYYLLALIVAIALVIIGFQLVTPSQSMAATLTHSEKDNSLTAGATTQITKEYINPKTLFSGLKYGFSQVITTHGGKTIYLSGQVAWDANEKIVGKGNLAVQARKALENLGLALEAVGATPEDVVQIEVFVVDYKPEYAEIIAEANHAFFPEETPPTSTLIGVQSLADPDLLIEIKATAVEQQTEVLR